MFKLLNCGTSQKTQMELYLRAQQPRGITIGADRQPVVILLFLQAFQ